MKLPLRDGGRIRFTLTAVGVTLAFLLAFRLVFFVVFHDRATSDPGVAHAVYLGLKFDLRLALLVGLPILLLSFPRRLDPTRASAARRLWLAYLVATFAGIAFLYFVDFGHYDYLRERLNSSAVEHLEATDIALEMVWESYPVVGLVLGLAAVVLSYALALRAATRSRATDAPRAPFRSRALASALATVLFALGIYGKLSWYPLRWSDAYFARDPFTVALALNPVLQLYDTWENREVGCDVDRVRGHYAEVAAYLGVDDPDAEALRFTRTTPPSPAAGRRPPNVVIVLCESFAAFKAGIFGNPLDPTPRFDALAREGTLFTRFFVPSGPTARSVFGMLTSVPDVNAASSATRNPLAVSQRMIANEFQGYRKLYFIGGSASWGNLRGVLQHNIPDLELHEEGDYDSPRSDVWGLSDLALVQEANAVLRTLDDEPFLAFVQTAGNHRPWTIPEDHGDFERVADIDPRRLREAGFDDLLEELNAMRFMDHALGELVALARQEDYFEDTLFFFFGDHGTATASVDPPCPGLTAHHVPFLIYGPGRLPEPRIVEAVASSLDVLPTAAGLSGLGFQNESMGRDLFDRERPASSFAFLRFGDRCGLVGDDFLLRFARDGSPRLYAYDSQAPLEEVAERHPQVAEQMGRLATGLLETARFMLQRGNP